MRPLTTHHSQLTRRDLMRLSAAGVVGYSLSGWMQALADNAAANPQRRKACILLWMDGGWSQTDTFSLKPGHPNGGLFKEIETATPGVRISEHLPRIATFMDKMAIIRTMDTGDANDHPPGKHLVHTGYARRGPIQYPTLGSTVAKQLGDANSALPNFVCIAPTVGISEAYSSGFLGPKYAPLFIGDRNVVDAEKTLKVPDLSAEVATRRFDGRVDLLKDLSRSFVDERPDVAPMSQQAAYDRAVTLMRTASQRAFNLDNEPARLRDAYGRNLFGQGCLLARRLVEQGVPFVEVTLGHQHGQHSNWDTHEDNFETVKRLSRTLDTAMGQLMTDLSDRGMLDSTLIVCAAEFGRTPQLPKDRRGGGRDHWTGGWSTVLAGGGIKGGQVIGTTSADGTKIEDRPVTAPEFIATIVKAIGIDPGTLQVSNTGRPIPIAEKPAKPIAELVG